jgi:hypothetical protein
MLPTSDSNLTPGILWPVKQNKIFLFNQKARVSTQKILEVKIGQIGQDWTKSC